MPTVRVLPDEIEFEAEEGQTIMDAAHDHGLYWPTTCGGQGICTSCACVVEEGAENLDEMGRGEFKTLAEDRGEGAVQAGRVRLACQARVNGGEVLVTKRGVMRE